MARKSRTQNDSFDPDAMYSDLEVYAKQKKPPFDFEMAAYAAVKRSQPIDRDGLVHYFLLLQIILKHAPGCYPSLALLRSVWLRLQDVYTIMSKDMSKVYEKSIEKWADQCADKIRIACKHVLALANGASPYLHEKLKVLTRMVCDPSSVSTSIQASSSATSSKSTRTLTHTISDSTDCSVKICNVSCRCPECLKIAGPEVLSDTESDASRAAAANTKTVPAVRGGHKRAANEIQKSIAERKKEEQETKQKKQKKQTKQKDNPKAERGPQDRIKIVPRYKPVGKEETYILIDKNYACGCTAKKHKDHFKIMEQIKNEMVSGDIDTTKEAAKKRFEEILAN